MDIFGFLFRENLDLRYREWWRVHDHGSWLQGTCFLDWGYEDIFVLLEWRIVGVRRSVR